MASNADINGNIKALPNPDISSKMASATNMNPKADAGPDATYMESEQVVFDGSASTDPDGDSLAFNWKQLSPQAPLMDLTLGSASFLSIAPIVDHDTEFEFQLTVTDGKGGESSDNVKILVKDKESSTAASGVSNSTLPLGSSNTTLPSIEELAKSAEPTESGVEGSGLSYATSDIEAGFNIAVAGDYDCGSDAQDTIDNIKSANPELVLALGDYSYGGDANCWIELAKPIEKNLKLVKGNHDIMPPEIWNQYVSGLDQSEKISSTRASKLALKDGYYYSFTRNGIYFIMMDSEVPLGVDSAQYKFVKNELEKASLDPQIKWKIVSLHRSVYYVDAQIPTPRDDIYSISEPILRQSYSQLFNEFGVDFVLSGHEHNYQRSYPIKPNSADFNSPTPTSTGRNNYINPDGQIYLVVGTGGAAPSGTPFFEAVRSGPLPNYIATTNGEDNKKGFLDMRFSRDNSLVTGTFLANDGTVIDRFTVTKGRSFVEPDSTEPLNITSLAGPEYPLSQIPPSSGIEPPASEAESATGGVPAITEETTPSSIPNDNPPMCKDGNTPGDTGLCSDGSDPVRAERSSPPLPSEALGPQATP